MSRPKRICRRRYIMSTVKSVSQNSLVGQKTNAP
jgi:hypothetical protein